MKQVIAGLTTTALVSGALALAGLSAGTAQAEDWCSPSAMVNGVLRPQSLVSE
jgi:hypothetical protein